MDASARYNPAQQEVIDLLGQNRHDRPSFDAGLRVELRAALEDGLAPLGDALTGQALWVTKHALSAVHRCEARFVAEQGRDFAWSAPLARGVISHKAIELALHWPGEPVAADLVDEAIARLGSQDSALADWLSVADDGDRAELRAAAVERVSAFTECFPPLQPRWYPVTEARQRAELLDGRIVLAGRVDLSLGRAEGTTAGKVLIDLKTGGFAPHHRDDLRFYALVETLRLGTPPRLVATYYLDSATIHPEAVDEARLEAAGRRVVAGARRLVALRDDPDTAQRQPGTACRWCVLADSCTPGRQHLEQSADRA